MEFDAELDDEEINGADVEATRRIVSDLIKAIGEDPEREGLKNTPDRVARMYVELFSGYTAEPERIVNGALFEINYDEMVIVRDIEFYSLCEHHMLPFIGRAHVAYIPKGKVIGLSKIPRIVDMYARRMQIQERMTRQIADFIQKTLEPQGVAVVVEAMHLCAMMRGVKKHDARMTTSAMHGSFRANLATRQEFLENIARGSKPLQF
ncbi:MAG TPA: GTP cyclohydrolase I FolE [Anaerolineales bacterium]|nr:GTP cyclohydrolase I FolE [Anaerolineales bacterium]HNS61192.1 GTP cyclohydrolase I FolE [Anaerolineales bacterium]